MKRTLTLLFGLLALSTGAQRSFAAATVFTSRAAFDAAVSGSSVTVQDFSGITWADGHTVDFGDFSFTADGMDPLVHHLSSPSLSNINPGIQFSGSANPTILTIDFDTPIKAFAFDVFDWASNSNAVLDGPKSLLIEEQSGLFSAVIASTPQGVPLADQNVQFFGVTSSTAFTRMIVRSATNADSVAFDGVRYATQVPEPTIALLSFLGFGALLIVRRR